MNAENTSSNRNPRQPRRDENLKTVKETPPKKYNFYHINTEGGSRRDGFDFAFGLSSYLNKRLKSLSDLATGDTKPTGGGKK